MACLSSRPHPSLAVKALITLAFQVGWKPRMEATALPLRALPVFLWLKCFPIAVFLYFSPLFVMPISLSSNVTHPAQSWPPTKLAQVYDYGCFYQLSTSSLYSLLHVISGTIAVSS